MSPELPGASAASVSLDLFALSSGLLGGLAFFLFGMEHIAGSLKQIAGERMRSILARLTSNRLMGLLTGAIVTAVIQSSSVTTVLVVGFVSGGVISLSQAIGVILGADIGTTITAQIMALNVTRYALLLIAAGFGLTFLVRKNGTRKYGGFLMGIGLIFYGMSLMSNAMSPLRSSPLFVNLLAAIENPLASVLASAVFTALIHSSAATIGIVIVLSSQGLITLETGIALSLGANVGTCATAGLAALGRSRPAVQAALAHVLFKTIGTLALLPFISWFASAVREFSPDVPARQIANAHTLFNVGIAVVFLPFTRPFAGLLEWLVPVQKEESEAEFLASCQLDAGLLEVPELALDQARREARKMGKVLVRMLEEGAEAIYRMDLEKMSKVREMDDSVDRVYACISEYLARISRKELTEPMSNDVLRAMSVIGHLESIGDIIETNLHHVVESAAGQEIQLTPAGIEDLKRLQAMVLDGMCRAVEAFAANDVILAQEVCHVETALDRFDLEFKQRHLARLHDSGLAERRSHMLEMSIADYIKRMYFHSRRAAERVMESHYSA